MSETPQTVESVVVDSTTETPVEKKPRFTRRTKAIIAAGAATAAAAAAVIVKMRSGDFEDNSVGDLTVVEDYTTYETLTDLESKPE